MLKPCKSSDTKTAPLAKSGESGRKLKMYFKKLQEVATHWTYSERQELSLVLFFFFREATETGNCSKRKEILAEGPGNCRTRIII